jgi:fatty acid desaturase
VAFARRVSVHCGLTPHAATRDEGEESVDWFYIYFIGFLILIAAVGLGLSKIGLGAEWIFIVCLGLFGLAVMSAVKHSRGGGGEAS